MTAATEQALEALLEHIKRERGFDFTGYKRASLERRIAKRMAAVGSPSYEAYLDHLEVQPDEFEQLFDTILINVTGFFRDEPAWEYLRQEGLPPLLAARGPEGAVRVWVAGCATGQEAYTVAMLLAEAMGEDVLPDRGKIYATDVDEEARATARQAVYSEKEVEGVAPELLERYFERADSRFSFRKELRRAVIFGRNDLVQDAPISRIDLLLCRNTLMYFTAETQARILGRFHFALQDDGLLFLGRSEMLLTRSELFRPQDLKRRVFRKVPRTLPRDRPTRVAVADAMTSRDGAAGLRERAIEASPVAQIVVDPEGVLTSLNDAAASAFGLLPEDVGRPLQDLQISYRPLEL